MPRSWTHLIRFIAQEDGQVHLGQIDPNLYPDVGLSTIKKQKVEAKLINASAFDGLVTEKTMTVTQVRQLPRIILG